MPTIKVSESVMLGISLWNSGKERIESFQGFGAFGGCILFYFT